MRLGALIGGAVAGLIAVPLAAAQPPAPTLGLGGPEEAPAVTTDQIGPPEGASAVQAPQVAGQSGAPPTSAPPQVNQLRRASVAALSLSTSAEAKGVRLPPVEGRDRCDAAAAHPPPECAHIIDRRAQEFANPPPQAPSPEQILLQSSVAPAPADTSMAVHKLGGEQATDPNAAAALDATIGGQRSVPTLPPSVTGTLNQAGVSSTAATNTAAANP